MKLENDIKNAIIKKLEDGTIEKVVEEQFENCIKRSLSDLFGYCGVATKLIEEQIKSVVVPYLENYDYSEYIVKLDAVLTEVLKTTTLPNYQILEAFKKLMLPIDKEMKTIKLTVLFSKWQNYVSKNVDTAGLEVHFNEGNPTYEYIEVGFDVEDDSINNWSSFEYSTVSFECDHDREMDLAFKLSRWKNDRDKNWTIAFKTPTEIDSLRHLSELEIYMMRLAQNNIKIELDKSSGCAEVEPEKEPEPTWS